VIKKKMTLFTPSSRIRVKRRLKKREKKKKVVSNPTAMGGEKKKCCAGEGEVLDGCQDRSAEWGVSS